MREVIITCAVTGSIHTPSMSEYLPVTPEQIATQAIEAARAGASIIHLHVRDPNDGRPVQDPALFRRVAPAIKEACDVVINITTGGAPTMPVAERLQPALQLKPEVASLNMGSMNFGLFEMLERYQHFKHEWEEKYLRGTEDLVFRNSFRDIGYILQSCADNGTRFELECYDIGHLYNVAHFLDRGMLKPPLFVQSVFGIRGGIGADVEDLMHMKRTADRLFGSDYLWSVLGVGRNQMRLATIGAALGGNVRVGLEDSLWDSPGRLARNNAEQVRRIKSILSGLSLTAASPEQARSLLKLKGSAEVGF